MKFTDVKTDSDIALKGIKAEIEWHDKAPKSVTLTDVDGRVVKIAKGEYSQLDVLIPAPPAMVEVWRVAGRIPGIQDKVLEYFKEIVAADYIEQDPKRGLHSALRKKLESDLAVYQPTADDVEQTYAACMAALAGTLRGESAA